MINPNGKGSCPSGFTRSTNYCTKKVGDDKGAKKGASGQSASASSSVNNAPDPERAIGGKPVLKRLAKRNELDYCPTGYHSSHANRGECVTPWAEAPNVSMRKGACAAGTTEERGQFCTGSTSLALNLMDAAYVADFNTLYMLRKQKGLDTGRDRARKRSNRTRLRYRNRVGRMPLPPTQRRLSSVAPSRVCSPVKQGSARPGAECVLILT